MNNRLITYGIVRSLYNQGREHDEVLQAFVLEALTQDPQSAPAIRSKISATHGFELKNYQVTRVLSALRKKDQVGHKGRKFWLAEGAPDISDFEAESRDLNREIAKLAKSGVAFFEGHGRNLTEEQFEGLLDKLLREQVAHVLHAIEPGRTIPETEMPNSKTKQLVLAFIAETERSDPGGLRTMKKMISGALMALSLRADGEKIPPKVQSLGKKISIYFDTNFLLHLLGFNGRDAESAAKEVHELLVDRGFTLRAFDFSVFEATHLLSKYAEMENRYVAGLDVDNIYSRMKNAGWTAASTLQYVSEFDETMEALQIEVETTDIDLDSYVHPDEEEAAEMSKQLNKKNNVLKHDLAATRRIREKRGNRKFSLSKARCLFLSTDHGLAHFNFRKGGHASRATIVEVILTSTLANILWMQDPHIDVPIKALVAANTATGLIDDGVWNKVREDLLDGLEEGSLNEDDLEALLYGGFLQGELSGWTSDSIDTLDLDDMVKRGREHRKESLATEREEITKNEQEKVKSEVDALKTELDASKQEQLATTKKEIDLKAELAQEKRKRKDGLLRWASRKARVYTISYAMLGIFIVLEIEAVLWATRSPNGYPVSILAALSLGPTLFGWNPARMWGKLEGAIRDGLLTKEDYENNPERDEL